MSESKDLFHEAKSFYQEKNYERALKLYKNLSELHPDNYSVWNHLGLCHARLEDYKKAIVAFEKAVQVNGTKELIWSNLGKAYSRAGEYTKVIENYEKALQRFPNNSSYLIGIGSAYIELNNLDRAINAFKLALIVDQESRIAWHNLCQAYGRIGIKIPSTDFKPESEASWVQLSTALLGSSLYKDALYATDRALRINPSFDAAIKLRDEITLIIKENEKLKEGVSKGNTDLSHPIEQTKGIIQIEDSVDTEPAKPIEPPKPKIVKPQKSFELSLSDSELIYINNKYHKIDECNFVIDGANVARESISEKKGGKLSRLNKLFAKLNSFGIKKYIILCDRSLNYTIDHKIEYKLLVKNGRITETPGGTQADHFILKYAKENNSYIISNDRFKEFRKIFDNTWLDERLITFKFIKDKLYFDKIYTVTE